MSRTRTNNNIATLTGSATTEIIRSTYEQYRYFKPNGQLYPSVGSTAFVTPPSHGITPDGKMGRSGSMEDSSGSSGFNRCYHVTETWQCPLVPFTLIGVCSPALGSVVTTSGSAGAASACVYGIDTVPFLATDEQLLAEACSSINPSVVKPMFDIAQNIGELQETLQSLYKLAVNYGDVANALDAQRRRNSPVVRRMLGKRTFEQLSIRDWSTLAASADLGYQLAVKPFLSSYRDLRRALLKVKEQTEKYYDSRHILHGVSTRVETASDSFVNPYSYTNSWGNERTYIKEVHATAEVIYHSPPSQALDGKIWRALFGAVPSVSTLYELTPFTFVVDYFWNLGQYLRQFAEKPIDEIQYTVLRQGWSVKTTALSKGWTMLATGYYTQDYQAVKSSPLIEGTLTKTTYLREPKVLDLTTFTPKPPEVRLPKPRQVATMGELLFMLKGASQRVFRVAR